MWTNAPAEMRDWRWFDLGFLHSLRVLVGDTLHGRVCTVVPHVNWVQPASIWVAPRKSPEVSFQPFGPSNNKFGDYGNYTPYCDKPEDYSCNVSGWSVYPKGQGWWNDFYSCNKARSNKSWWWFQVLFIFNYFSPHCVVGFLFCCGDIPRLTHHSLLPFLLLFLTTTTTTTQYGKHCRREGDNNSATQQAWHFQHLRCDLRGSRGTFGTFIDVRGSLATNWVGLALRIFLRDKRGTFSASGSICMAGVALSAMQARFVW